MNTILKVKDIGKTYRVERSLFKQITNPFGRPEYIRALDSVSFSLGNGNILGIVGSNGAGKTTLIRILADLLKTDNGYVEIEGKAIGSNFKLRRKIGYVSSDERSFFWRLTGRQNLEFFGKLYGLSNNICLKRVSQLLEMFNFIKKADYPFRDYSAGMRKKVSIMRSLLHSPQVLLLDEITNSLDPDSTREVKALVREYVSEKSCRCAVWSTHRLEEIGQVCDNVLMIQSGSVSYLGDISDYVKAKSQKNKYVIKTKNMGGQLNAFRKCLEGKGRVEILSKQSHSEIKIDGLSEDEFGDIISVAVKDYGAFILFAGCAEKETDVWPEVN